jgi:hypothetical protein
MAQLYLHAEQEGVAKEVVDADTKSTVHDVYCEALLLSLTDPYRLVAGELDKVMAQMRAWRGLATPAAIAAGDAARRALPGAV